MAWRDSRASRRRLLLLSLSVVFGIGALVAIGSVSANLRRAIDEQANSLLGADVVIHGAIPTTAAWSQALADAGATVAREREIGATLTAGAEKRRVLVRAIEGEVPFYGDFVTEPADAAARLRPGGRVVILASRAMESLQLRVGDQVGLGRDPAPFTVIGAMTAFPGEFPQLNLRSPLAFIPFSALSTDLGTTPTRVDLRLPPGRPSAGLVRDLKARFSSARLVFATADERRHDLDNALAGFDAFFHLVGFVALFLGAIGVASVVHVYVRQKVTTVAILRCLGASSAQTFAIYLLQGLGLGLFGAVVGAAIGLGAQRLLPWLLRDLIPFRIHFFIAWPAVASGMASGLVICLLFTLLPLLEVRRVSPLAAFRSALAERAVAAFDPWRVVIAVLIPSAVAGFAIWQTKSLPFGLGYTIALGVAFGTLGATAWVISWAARRFFPRHLPYLVRQGVANLYRPNNRTVLLLLSIGLGAFLMIALFLTRTQLLDQVRGPQGSQRPNLIMSRVEDEQMAPLAQIVSAAGASISEKVPFVSMTLLRVNGKPPRPDPRRPRDQGVTLLASHRGHLLRGEEVVEGKLAARAEPGAAEIPIAVPGGRRRPADRLYRLGDVLEWDVQGIPMRTRVSAVLIRAAGPDFAGFASYDVIFPEGAIDGAPASYRLGIHADSAAGATKVREAIVAAFPNLQVVDLTAILSVVLRIFDKVAFVIGFMASFIVATGVIMLVSAILTGRFQRIRETVLLRTLGASHRQLVLIQLVEYAILGVLASLVGTVLAVGGNLLLVHFVFHLPPDIPVLFLLEAAAGVTAITLLTGWLANRGITNHPPLAVLRQET